MKTPIFMSKWFSRSASGVQKTPLELLVTLWPTFSHFARFTHDKRIAGVRLNSAMITNPELDDALRQIAALDTMDHLWFDFKGRQLRVAEVHPNEYHLDITLNHPIKVETPTVVLFKAGADSAVLDHLEEGGKRLVFKEGALYGPKKFMVTVGESLHIRHPSFRMLGEDYTPAEIDRIEKVYQFGFRQFHLSYVETSRGVQRFLELVPGSRVVLKIETRAGLEFVAREFRKTDHCSLMAACGDLYAEIEKPHLMAEALKLIVKKDPEACAGSRIMLSVGQPLASDVKKAAECLTEAVKYLHECRAGVAPDKQKIDELADQANEMIATLTQPQIPSCADFLQLAWLYDAGYRRMMLCDELCLKEDLLATAINAFDAFRSVHAI